MLSDIPLSLGFLAEFNAQTALKLLIVALASPLWWPIARAMRNEVIEALAPGGGMLGTKQKREMRSPPPGLDPFVSVPMAHHRRKTQAVASQAVASRAGRPPSGAQQSAAPRRPSF